VVARHGQDGRPEGAKEVARPLVLAPASAIGQIAGGDDDLGAHLSGEPDERCLDLRVLACTDVEIGNMEDACGHERMRL
jgi:hypothetical protein